MIDIQINLRTYIVQSTEDYECAKEAYKEEFYFFLNGVSAGNPQFLEALAVDGLK